MRFITILKKFTFLIAISIVIFSCQEATISDQTEPIDQDMINAIDMADNYMSANVSTARRNSPKAVTVLQYKDGVLVYNTNTG